jgi:RNA polymerase sigma-70 factor (ECF subfamily)
MGKIGRWVAAQDDPVDTGPHGVGEPRDGGRGAFGDPPTGRRSPRGAEPTTGVGPRLHRRIAEPHPRARIPTEEAAVARLEIGELRSFVVGLAHKLGRGRVDPEDLAQDVLERWLRATPILPPIANPRAWMAVVLRHLLFDRLRRQRVAAVVPAETAGLVAIEREERAWWRELDAAVVARELANLPRALRETFRLFTFEARSYRQIARRLKIAKGTVGTRISRARALLKRRLIEHRAASLEGPAPGS